MNENWKAGFSPGFQQLLKNPGLQSSNKENFLMVRQFSKKMFYKAQGAVDLGDKVRDWGVFIEFFKPIRTTFFLV